MPAMKVRRRPSRSPARAPSRSRPPNVEGVGADHPGQARGAEAERALDVGERDVHDRRVQDDHQLGDEDDGEDERRGGWCRAPRGSEGR